MGLQDKIFDVRAALDGKPEQEDFDEVMDYYFSIEDECFKRRKQVFEIERAFGVIASLMKLRV